MYIHRYYSLTIYYVHTSIHVDLLVIMIYILIDMFSLTRVRSTIL